jgi:hypothetical protein
MIEKQVRMAKEIGRPLATAEQTRQMLKIGVTYKSTEETLANIGLPPNREGSNKGFLVHKTDGRLHPARRAVAAISTPVSGRMAYLRIPI